MPLSIGEGGSTSKTIHPGPRRTSVPSDILTYGHNTPTLQDIQVDRHTAVQQHMANRFFKRFALCYQTVVCLSVLSCMSVSPVCNVGVLWPNAWTNQDETWRAGRPRPCPHCARWGPKSPSSKGAQPPVFSRYMLWPNGSMIKMPLGRKVCLDPNDTVLDGNPAPRSPKRGQSAPNFGPCLLWPNG